eukprot:scaffold166949_cov32-Tisochrysis_lutea.AAC.10
MDSLCNEGCRLNRTTSPLHMCLSTRSPTCGAEGDGPHQKKSAAQLPEHDLLSWSADSHVVGNGFRNALFVTSTPRCKGATRQQGECGCRRPAQCGGGAEKFAVLGHAPSIVRRSDVYPRI